MYILSEKLKNKIEKISKNVYEMSHGLFIFEEYIAIPYYGHIILRFDIAKEDYSLDELDTYEELIYRWVDDDFLIDFMGSVYKKLGFNIARMNEIFLMGNEVFNNEKLIESIYASKIREDGAYLLKAGGYDEGLNVWEIQIDEGELVLLILGNEVKVKEKYSVDDFNVQVIEVDSKPSEGLMRAILYARRNHISLMKVIHSLQSKLDN